MKPRLYSYVVARDYGFAPNPFFGYCTLATCKPIIRRKAQVGDWVVGTGSKTKGLGDRLVYAMRVQETLSFDQYWRDSRFRVKRPTLHGSRKQAFGDNIYHSAEKSGNNRHCWIQEDSHHSLEGGLPNKANIANDTQTNRVLISSDFVYFGKAAPKIPTEFRRAAKNSNICGGRGHRSKFSDSFIEAFVKWIRCLPMRGYAGEPSDFFM